MKNIPFTEFRKQASEIMTDVENGETFVVLRHGRPVAEIRPIENLDTPNSPSWQRPALRLKLQGKALSELILDDR